MRKLFISFSAFLFCQQCLTLDLGSVVQLCYKGNSECSPDNIIQYVLHNPNSIEMFVLYKRTSHLGTTGEGTETVMPSEPALNNMQRDPIPILRFKELIYSLTKQNIETSIRNMRESFEPMKYRINENANSLEEGEESEKKRINRIIQNMFPGLPIDISGYECRDEQNKTETLDIIKKVCLSVRPQNANHLIYVKYPTTEETSRKVFEILSNFPSNFSVKDIKKVGNDQFATVESKNNDTDASIVGILPVNINEKVEQGIEHTIKNHILKEATDIYFIEPEIIKKEIHHGSIRKPSKRAIENKGRMNASRIIPIKKNTKDQEDKKIKIQVINNLLDKDSKNTSFLSKAATLEEDEEDTDENEDEEENQENENSDNEDEDEEDEDEDEEDEDEDEEDGDEEDGDEEDGDEDEEDADDTEDKDDVDNSSAKESLANMAHDLLDASTGKGRLSVKQVKVLKDLTDKVKKHNTIDDIKKYASENNEEIENKISEYQAYQKKTIQKIHESKESIYDMINMDLNTLLKPAQKEYLKVAESLKQKLLKQYDDMLNELKEDQ